MDQDYRKVFDTLAVAIWEHDASEVKRATERLRARGIADMRRFVADHPAFLRSLKSGMRFTDINATALELLGIDCKEKFLASLADHLPDDDETFADFVVAVDEDRPGFGGETWIRRADGRRIAVKFAMKFPPGTDYTRIVNSMFDVTESKAVQEALERTRADLEGALRLASLGELSATIAHEVNQPLSAVVAYTQAGQRWLARDRPELNEARTAAANAVAAAERAAGVVKRVRKMMGKLAPDRAPVMIEPIILEAIGHVAPQAARRGVVVRRRFEAGNVAVTGDGVLLSQVFVNLLTNAFQALETIVDRPRQVAVSTSLCASGIVVRVSDNGLGFGENASRSLDPLFTTKPDGMGLGLAISRSTVEAHDGTIVVGDNLEGIGAYVEIVLPTSGGDPAVPTPTPFDG